MPSVVVLNPCTLKVEREKGRWGRGEKRKKGKKKERYRDRKKRDRERERRWVRENYYNGRP